MDGYNMDEYEKLPFNYQQHFDKQFVKMDQYRKKDFEHLWPTYAEDIYGDSKPKPQVTASANGSMWERGKNAMKEAFTSESLNKQKSKMIGAAGGLLGNKVASATWKALSSRTGVATIGVGVGVGIFSSRHFSVKGQMDNNKGK